MNQPIVIKRPQRPVNQESIDFVSPNKILTVEDAIAHYSKLLELAPQLLDILVNQRYGKNNLQSLAEHEKIDLLSHQMVAKSISELNEKFTQFLPRKIKIMTK